MEYLAVFWTKQSPLCDHETPEPWAPGMPKIEWPMGRSKINVQEFPWNFDHRAHNHATVRPSLFFPTNLLYLVWNEHGTIYAISSDFGDRMTTQHLD